MSNFDLAVEYVLSEEGGIETDEDDNGGLTKFGLSFNFLKNIPTERMKQYGMNYADDEHLHQLITDLDIETAKKVYKGEFWSIDLFQKIESQNLCDRYFDCAVLSGIAAATRFVQRAICAYVGDSESLLDDGVCGSKTLEKINFYGDLILPSLRSERAGYYREIVLRKTSQEKFLKGWLKRAYK